MVIKYEEFINTINELRHAINIRLGNREPILLVAITAVSVVSGLWFLEQIYHPEGIKSRLKKKLFKIVRKIPMVSKKIEKEMEKISEDFEKSVLERTSTIPYITTLPSSGMLPKDILEKVNDNLHLGEFDWKKGFVSGTVYNFNEELIELLTKVYGVAFYTNPLHSDVFPGVIKMEAEVIKMVADIFNGGPNACGAMTSGGTESILMACKAYRDYGREERGITRPEMILPRTAHPAFDKAASYFGIATKYIPVDPLTYSVSVRDVKKAISRNTIMLVGSVPNYPYGTLDDIPGLAAIGRLYNIPLHVDCCLGGFIAPFMSKAGFSFPQFDFSVPGVTSISADTHKYGFAPKGSSVILYSNPKFRRYQYCVTTDWPGGVYGSPTISGSRSGGIVTASWATLMYFGLEGYIESTKKIVNTTLYIESELRKIDGIYIFGKPATSVVAFSSKIFDIYRLLEALNAKGWNLNNLQFPSAVHLCVTFLHTADGMADKFINDVREATTLLMKDPKKPVEGALALYGVSQALPDRSLVGDITRLFIDYMYFIPKDKRKLLNGHSL